MLISNAKNQKHHSLKMIGFFLNCGVRKCQVIVPLVVALVFMSCHKDKTLLLESCSAKISYSTDIIPIIQNSCMTNLGPGTGCHDAWITEHSNIVNYINNDSWQNAVWGSYTMPKIPNNFSIDSLTSGEVQIMKCWVEQGFPEN
jgi:hypothetical protein